MTMSEEQALNALLFDTPCVELVDIKCFRGDRPNVNTADIRKEVHSGLLQYKMQPNLASKHVPTNNIAERDMRDLIKDLPVAA